ncbi:Transcriptional regulator [Staphylococcus equorum subsp. equorum]|uniref:DUF722 domain-containing protein n=1 Tax=Staphylococcus equorum TaxID=246432 RepID=UPI000623CFCE|nr:DUF722 domain-containing protein [Staphylococcus equorum]KKI55457.1 Transcriptional regulator [Staphylococcus equorum subsp. equorum]MEB7746274.1 DUF722 domain-containing protein [Staphylococcus equorum]UTT55164.1 DUF722 domain-containing protein [Staphylococcus equorum]UTT55225.1 DUF722 domain-containing protein [Staphylococcus equorum]
MKTLQLERLDRKKLEEYIAKYKEYKRELRFTEFLIMENHEPDNLEGGQSNLIGRPVENEVIKKNEDKRYRHLSDVVNGVQRLYDNSDEETQEMIRLRYWECPIGKSEWKDIANHFCVSEGAIYRKRLVMLDELAKYIGYV